MGAAPGAPSEEGTYLDGEAALDFARNPLGIDPAQTVPFGRSLGAAVAAEMATQFDSQALILESPFASIRAIA
jgi:pimeloyl-ACP methyl ester carboxylesterase